MSKKHIHRRKTKKEAKNRFKITSGKSGRGKSYFIVDEAHDYLDNPRNIQLINKLKLEKKNER